METVNVQLAVPKETKEVVDCLGAIYDHVKAGKSLQEAVGLFDELSAAAKGVDLVDDEMKTANRSDAAGYLVKQLLDRIMPVEAPVEA